MSSRDFRGWWSRGCAIGDARALLSSAVRVPLDERVRERLVAETRGNPLALLELPRGLTPAELAGGFGLLDTPGLSGRIEDSFRRRLAGLPADTQRLLLVAASEPVGDPVLVWRAADRLGIAVQAASKTDGLLAIGARVTFRHPLVRSSVYQAASLEDRQAVHRALADATDPEVDPDRRAWHLAQATPGPDEDVASELERSAGRAQARGGLAAAAAFLERATALTPEPSRRAGRALAAAQAKRQAGAFDAALRLVAIAESGPLNELQRAEVELLRGQIAFALSPGSDASPLLLKAAKSFEPLDQRLARETYLEALIAVFFPGLPASDDGVLEAARAARAAPPAPPPLRASDLLLDGLALVITDGYAAGSPALTEAVKAFRGDDISQAEGRRWLSLGSRVAALLWDDESWDVLSARLLQLARDAGALSVLPLALNTRAGVEIYAGRFAMVSSLLDEMAAANAVTGAVLAPYAALALATLRVVRKRWRSWSDRHRRLLARGEGLGIAASNWATALLNNGLGRYDDAFDAAVEATRDATAPLVRHCALVELIEAARRSGAGRSRGAEALGIR